MTTLKKKTKRKKRKKKTMPHQKWEKQTQPKWVARQKRQPEATRR
jgi:hypothetical protein